MSEREDQSGPETSPEAEPQAGPVAPEPTVEPAPVESASAAGDAPVAAQNGQADAAKDDLAGSESAKAETASADAGKGNAPEAAAADGAKAAAAPAGAEPERQRRPPRNPALIRAWRYGRPVEGTVAGVIKGGYEVQVGRARGFCPHSQIDLQREDKPEERLGQTYKFKVTQLRRGGEDVVLSRRVLLEEQRTEEAKAVRATLLEGSLIQGRVAGTAQFGAFVDLGAGVMGLTHISELSHDRIRRVEDAVSVGDTVSVKILKIRDDGRISLSVRQATEDPWSSVATQFPPGSKHSGKVSRVADFGAFIELAPGIEALAPAGELPPTDGDGWQSLLQPGTEHEWVVLSVDGRGRRISVTLPGGVDEPAPLEPDSEREGRVQRLERYGVFLWLGPGQVGLMPRAWAGVSGDAELRSRFKIGDTVQVRVVDIREDGRRIRLAIPGMKTEREEPRRQSRPEPKVQQESSGPFGTSLADKLRAALGQTGDD